VNARHPAPTFDHLQRRPARWRRALGCGALLWLLSSVGAEPAARAQALAARALFDEARRLMSAGQFAAACPKLEESQRLRAGIGTQFNLAECYEKLGRSASAWSLYLRVAADTKALGQPEREQVARQRARALEPRVAYLVLQVSAPVAGLQLTLDASALGPAVWGIATPIDPGEHAVVAQARGYTAWQGVARIPDRAARITLDVPRLLPEAPAARASAAASPAAAAAKSPGPTLASSPADSGSASEPDHTVPYVIGGVGAGFVVLSGLFGLRFLHDNNEAKKICVSNSNACPHDEIEHHQSLLGSARDARKAGFGSLLLGLAGLGVSAIWLLQDTKHEHPDEHVALDVELGPDAALLGCSMPFHGF
jgi:serine/threonine-protein kinase